MVGVTGFNLRPLRPELRADASSKLVWAQLSTLDEPGHVEQRPCCCTSLLYLVSVRLTRCARSLLMIKEPRCSL